jgi:8-amino-7-oxononanoate synthase
LNDDSLLRYVSDKLASLDADELLRTLEPTRRDVGASAYRRGRRLVSFACNDYLGLSQHPDVIEASCAATRELGAGAGASRHVTGDHPLYRELEQKLAALKGTEDAVVFGSGYLTNIGVIPALLGPQDLIVMDRLCHSCLHAGARLAGSRVLTFAHNDVGDAESLLAAHRSDYRHCMLLTEGVFSMDGDRAPVAALLAAARRHDAWLMTDDAHGLGVVGDGRGSAIVAGNAIDVPLQMGTLSKAVGSYGGYVCTSRAVADFIRNRARSLIYTTGLPPGVIAAAGKALDIIASDGDLVAKPLAAARRFAERLGMPQPESAVLPIVLGTPQRALAASRALEERGYLVVAIRPPTVPEGTARLRLAFSAAHSDDDIDGLAEAVERTLAAL